LEAGVEPLRSRSHTDQRGQASLDAIVIAIACWVGLSIVLGPLVGRGLRVLEPAGKRVLPELNEMRAGGQRRALERTLPPPGQVGR
jgi:hypothetical protein